MDLPVDVSLDKIVSGGGAIFAVAVACLAGLFAWLAGRSETRAWTKRETVRLSSLIYPDVIALETQIANTRERLNRLVQDIPRMSAQEVASRLPQYAYISVPVMLEESADGLFQLHKKAGSSCVNLLDALLKYASLVEGNAKLIANLASGASQEHVDDLKDVLKNLERVRATCFDSLRPFLAKTDPGKHYRSSRALAMRG